VLRKYENDLLQKEHSGCAALLRDDKVRGESSLGCGGVGRLCPTVMGLYLQCVC